MKRRVGSGVVFALLTGFAPAGVITAGVAVGLFFSHLLSDLVPDALAIGVCMFAAGALSGLVVGLSHRAHRPLGAPASSTRRDGDPRTGHGG